MTDVPTIDDCIAWLESVPRVRIIGGEHSGMRVRPPMVSATIAYLKQAKIDEELVLGE
jgi:hypothetical protein